MLYKYLIFFLIPLFLIGNGSAKAAILNTGNVNTWTEDIQNIQSQRQDIKNKMARANETEKIQLNRQDTTLSNYENAYTKAINLLQPGQIGSSTPESFNASFLPPVILPGQSVPSEYVPYYKAAGAAYGVDWTILAAIHKIETNYSRIQIMISSVGAIGHMQFMPSTFAAYGVDGNGDGIISPWNIQDSIFTAAHYLAANGFSNDPRGAIWHYNHANWYVNDVLQTAAIIKQDNN